MFDRAYSSHMEEKKQIAPTAPAHSRRRSQDLPLFYIALGLSVCVYLGLLVLSPANQRYEEMFPTMHNPNMHPGLTVASHSSESTINH